MNLLSKFQPIDAVCYMIATGIYVPVHSTHISVDATLVLHDAAK